MKSIRPGIALIASLIAVAVHAQVRIDRPVQVSGPTDAQRQVTGLTSSTEAGEVLTATVDQSGVHRFDTPVSGLPWQVDLPALAVAPQAGLHLLVSVPSDVVGPVSLLLNGTGPYTLALPDGSPLDASLTEAGTLLSLVFDGSGFQVMNGPVHGRYDCPVDMVTVNGSYCIDGTESPPLNYLDASLACGNQGKRLCTWGELHKACNDRVALGIIDLLNNWEWTNNTADSDFNVRTMGLGDCEANQRIHGVNNTRNFRCCLTR